MPADTLYHGGKAIASRDGSTVTIERTTITLSGQLTTEVMDEIVYRMPEYRADPFRPLVDTARFPWTPGTGAAREDNR